MKIEEMLKNEKKLVSTLEGKAQLRDMVWFIVEYVKENMDLPDENFRNRLHQKMGVRRSKIDETIKALDDLCRKRYYEKVLSNPFLN